MAFLKPQYIKHYGNGKYLTRDTKVLTEDLIIRKLLEAELKNVDAESGYFNRINFISQIPLEIKERVQREFSTDYVENDEGYIIDAKDDINIYSSSGNGLFYGCMALIHMMENGYLEHAFIYDYPVSSVRGVKVYLPGQENIPYFKEFVDMICYYKYNTIMIEVGGAMEYKKHPEINRKWV
jgi:hexosaminidase